MELAWPSWLPALEPLSFSGTRGCNLLFSMGRLRKQGTHRAMEVKVNMECGDQRWHFTLERIGTEGEK